jgi:predicted AlkP superfamily phosphohydrolase/phosphomutase
MTAPLKRPVSRRSFLKRSALAAGTAAVGAGGYWLGSQSRVSRAAGTKVIVIGIDGMDPRLAERMMGEGLLPNLARLRDGGGYSRLGTSTPPQSPVAWANFINGAGPGSHGIFDFLHRHPEQAWRDGQNPFTSMAETIPGDERYVELGDCQVQLDFWPYNHQPATTVLRRQGVPFWDYLDEAGVPSTFYDVPCNFPPSPSHHGHHRCLCGMGTPDLQGGLFGIYQLFFSGDSAGEPGNDGGGRRDRLTFERDTATARLLGPPDGLGSDAEHASVELQVHRDRQANAAVVEIQGRRILLRARDWSRWTKVSFWVNTGCRHISGICRFYLQEVAPNFRLFVTPINIDPSDPALRISEPNSFVQQISQARRSPANPDGLFYTTGFQEETQGRKYGVFDDDEFARQAQMVLEERFALFEHAIQNYDDGMLFFYFSSSDLQSHIFWWDSDDQHPLGIEPDQARQRFRHVHRLYRQLDAKIGDIVHRYGSQATILVMSDHGFANWGKQFNLNSWLRDEGYLGVEASCTSIAGRDVDWSQIRAYGLGINGLYLNLKGRERSGVVEPGEQQEEILTTLKRELEAYTDEGRRVIRGVYRADQIYEGPATALAPDLIIGYSRGYRSSWETGLGGLTPQVILDNDQAWSADHCIDALEVPGVLFSNRPLWRGRAIPSLVDVAPSILATYGLPTPPSMKGRSIFTS